MIIPAAGLAGLIFCMIVGSTPAVATDFHLPGAQLAVDVCASYRSEALFAGEGPLLAGEIHAFLQRIFLIEDETCLLTRLQAPDFRIHSGLPVQQIYPPIHR